MIAYDYALLRLVADVATGDGEAVGVVLHARRAGVLALRWAAPPDALARAVAARWPGLDAALAARSLAGAAAVAAGGPDAGPLGRLPPSERFHFLVAVRSSGLQATPVRTGLADDPAACADAIARTLCGWLRDP